MENREFVWYEKYRPQTIDELTLPESVKEHLKFRVENGIMSTIFHGPPGIGKTTAAIAMCREAGVQYKIINASKDRGIDMLRTTVTDYASTVSLEGKYKVIILDEADGLSKDAQDALRGIAQDFSENCKFILTLNTIENITDALHSRFPAFEFKISKEDVKPMMVEFFKACLKIMDTEGIQYEKAVVADIIQKKFPDFRSILARLQFMQTKGGINLTTYNGLNRTNEFENLIGWLKEKNFDSLIEWSLTEADINSSIFRDIYEIVNKNVSQVSKANLIMITNRYQVQATMAIDPAINLGAYLTELMVEMDFNE